MKTEKRKFGFTIVELLTVMAVIALLLAILTPALSVVRRISKDTAQRAQFHSIDVALEAYSGDMGDYPDSGTLPWASATSEPGNPPFTVGAMRLAEALVGRDLLGLDPWSSWDAYKDSINTTLYIYGRNSTPADVNASLDRRKGPYLDPQSAGAYQISQLYDNKIDVYDDNTAPAPVLTDIYYVKTVSKPGAKQVRAGSPVLYYKANVTTRTFPAPADTTIDNYKATESIFNSQDNEPLLELGAVSSQTKEHHFKKDYTGTTDQGRINFYNTITNPSITTQVRPYNQTSYILMSAGFDGIFGTPDDVYNFKN